MIYNYTSENISNNIIIIIIQRNSILLFLAFNFKIKRIRNYTYLIIFFICISVNIINSLCIYVIHNINI